MKKATVQYIKCPRCELNYILKKDKFCDVCKSEMKAGILKESDLEEMDLLEEGMELCPICKVNYVNPGERMCTTCQEEQVGDIKDDEPDWRGFVDKADDTDDEEIDLLPVEEDGEIVQIHNEKEYNRYQELCSQYDAWLETKKKKK